MKKTSIQPYDRLKTITLEEGFELISTAVEKRVIMDGAAVSVQSTRLTTFLLCGPQCSYEGCVYSGTFFAVERDLKDAGKDGISKPYHLNLWGVDEDGREVLFTHDHKLARCLGGADHVNNTQTMCCWHNWMKSKKESHLANQRRAAALANGETLPLSKRGKKKKAMKEKRVAKQLARQLANQEKTRQRSAGQVLAVQCV